MARLAEGAAHQLVVVDEAVEGGVDLGVAGRRGGLVEHGLQPGVLVLDEALRVLGLRGDRQRERARGRGEGEQVAESLDGEHDGWLFASERLPLQVSMQGAARAVLGDQGLDGSSRRVIQNPWLSPTWATRSRTRLKRTAGARCGAAPTCRG